MATQRVVVVGGGFAGLEVAKGLASRDDVQVTLVDRRNFHLFQPLLYQVATGALSGANIAAPLRRLLRRQRNATVVLAEVTGFDVAGRTVRLDGGTLPYDTLVVAAGSRPHYFGHPEWEAHAPGLKTLEDAVTIRSRVFKAFEDAELCADEASRQAYLTFVVVGGGPTSVELAGALAEIARKTLVGEFRCSDPRAARIVVVEADGRIMGQLSPESSHHAEASLSELGVEVLTRTRVTSVDANGVDLETPKGPKRIDARTVLWGAGVGASPLGTALSVAAGVMPAKGGRVAVDDHCRIPGHPEVFVIGDLASFTQHGAPLPGVAQVAVQQGQYVAKAIIAGLRHTEQPAFTYRSKGDMATIGKRRAVVEIGRWHVRGRLAWIMWLVLHLAKLVRAENRLLVLVQWGWYYFTGNRSARLIIVGASPVRVPNAVDGAPVAADCSGTPTIPR